VKTPSDPGLVDFLASRAARTMVFADVITFYLVGGDDENYRLRWTTASRTSRSIRSMAIPCDAPGAPGPWRSAACARGNRSASTSTSRT
jgi:hypothetical protein